MLQRILTFLSKMFNIECFTLKKVRYILIIIDYWYLEVKEAAEENGENILINTASIIFYIVGLNRSICKGNL